MEITRGKWSHGNEGQPFVLPGIDFFISLTFCNLTTPSVTLILSQMERLEMLCGVAEQTADGNFQRWASAGSF